MIYSNTSLLSRRLSGYVKASTDNPTGWRPQYTRLGDLHRGPQRPLPRVLRLGDDQSDPAPNTGDAASQANWISRQFQQMQAALFRHETDIKNLIQSGNPVPAEVAAEMVQLRNDFESALSQYNFIYRATFAEVPKIPGLQGMGFPFVAAGVFVVILGLIALWWQHERNIASQIQVAQTQANSQAQLANQLPGIQAQIVDAQARGDDAAVASLTDQYNRAAAAAAAIKPNDPNSWSSFFSNNIGWIAAGVIGVMVVSKI